MVGRENAIIMDNVKGWTALSMSEMLVKASRRKDWQGICAESSLMSPDDPIGQGTELN